MRILSSARDVGISEGDIAASYSLAWIRLACGTDAFHPGCSVSAGVGWLANQAIGFGFLGYPLDPMMLAWGVTLNLSAVAAVGGATVALRRTRTSGPVVRAGVAFVGASAAQQGTVLAASLVLVGVGTAFAPAAVWMII